MKTYLSLLVLLFSVYAHADNHLAKQKIAVLKHFYEQYFLSDEELEKSGDKYDSVLFFTPKYLAMTNTDVLEDDEVMECVDYDPYVQGQDYENEIIKKTISYTPKKDGSVQVTFKNFRSDVSLSYQFSCQNNKCLISDLIIPAYNDGEIKQPEHSYPQEMQKCIKEQIEKRL